MTPQIKAIYEALDVTGLLPEGELGLPSADLLAKLERINKDVGAIAAKEAQDDCAEDLRAALGQFKQRSWETLLSNVEDLVEAKYTCDREH